MGTWPLSFYMEEILWGRDALQAAYLEYRWGLPPDDGVVQALVALVVGAVDGGA